MLNIVHMGSSFADLVNLTPYFDLMTNNYYASVNKIQRCLTPLQSSKISQKINPTFLAKTEWNLSPILPPKPKIRG